jgi:hypothetical protein
VRLELTGTGSADTTSNALKQWTALGSSIELERLSLNYLEMPQSQPPQLLDAFADPTFCPFLRTCYAGYREGEKVRAALETRRQKREAQAAAAAAAAVAEPQTTAARTPARTKKEEEMQARIATMEAQVQQQDARLQALTALVEAQGQLLRSIGD